MNENLVKILKWGGIIALVSLPLLLLAKRRDSQTVAQQEKDSNDIFAEELEEVGG